MFTAKISEPLDEYATAGSPQWAPLLPYEVGPRRTLGSRLGLGFSAFSMGSSGLV